MPYVERNEQGRVVGRYANPQPGYAEEWLDDSSPELLPTFDELKAANIAAIQAELDRRANVNGYDNIVSACSYAAQPDGAAFQAEGAAFLAWRTQTWQKAFAVLAEVEAGTIPMPTPEEAVAAMPTLILP